MLARVFFSLLPLCVYAMLWMSTQVFDANKYNPFNSNYNFIRQLFGIFGVWLSEWSKFMSLMCFILIAIMTVFSFPILYCAKIYKHTANSSRQFYIFAMKTANSSTFTLTKADKFYDSFFFIFCTYQQNRLGTL